jgi:16S rRNA (adenine1518-N6/adenine1519-N6)-dimethyltransferase
VPKKSLGQVMLVDNEVAREIVLTAGFKPEDRVFEIGAGRGILTAFLIEKGIQTICCEIDRQMVEVLKGRFGHKENFKVLQEDILILDLDKIFPREDFQVLGNLPYHLTSEILFKFFDYVKILWDNKEHPRVKTLSIMIQKEVAQRLLSDPGQREWGVLAIYTHLYGEVERLLEVPAECFNPRPKVDSTVVKITFRNSYPFEIQDYSLFQKLIKVSFGKRRKMLKNTLYGLDLPHDLDFDLTRRPETLAVEEFAFLANAIRINSPQRPKDL